MGRTKTVQSTQILARGLQVFLVAALVIGLALVAGRPAKAQEPGDWTEYASNPIFGEWVGGPKAYYPSVLYDPDEFSGHGISAKYKMWYGTTSSQTALATSSDGVSWTDQGIVMTDGYHATVEYYPEGFAGANTGENPSSSTMYYRMWYWDVGTLYDVSAIGYTESPDGVSWYNRQPLQNGTVPIVSGGDPGWNRGSYGPADVLYSPGASNTGTDWTFTMYYDGTTGGSEALGLGFSADGITWTGYDADSDGKADPVFEGTGVVGDWDENYVSRATIIKNADNDYEMWYSGGVGAMNHGIGYATSSDGINWTRDTKNPVFHKDDTGYPGAPWRNLRTYTPSVIKDGAVYKMWFAGKEDSSGDYSIGYATVPPPSEVWVDDNWAGTTPGDDPDGAGPATSFGDDAFATIQDGIDNVADGGTVNVAAGTYNEDLTIDSKDNLQLSGAGVGSTTIKGIATEPWASWPLAIPNIDIQADGVEIHGFTIESPDVPNGEYSSGVVLDGTNTEIYDNAFVSKSTGDTGTDDGGSVSFQTYRDDVLGYDSDISGLNVHDNTFSGTPGGGYVGVFINHTLAGSGTVSIESNDFSGNVVQGVWTERSNTTIRNNSLETQWGAGSLGLIVKDFDARAQDNVSLSNNTVTGFEAGIRLGTGGQTLTNVSLTGNDVTSNVTGILVSADAAAGSEAHFNNIVGNDLGVDNEDPDDAFDAINNWWGDTDGPCPPSSQPACDGLGDAITSNVTYDPFIGAETEGASSETLNSGNTTVDLDVDGDGTPEASAEYSGSGSATVTLAKYAGNPGTEVTGLIGDGSDNYFDVNVSSNTDPNATLTITFDTDANEGDPLYWYNGTAWRQVIDNSGSVPTADANGDYSVTFGPFSTPTLNDLSGTPFAPGEPFGIAAQVSADTLALNDTITVDILGKASDLWAVDFTLNFNVDDGDGEADDVLEGTSVSLPSVSDDSGMNAAFVVEQDIDNGAGTVRVAYSQSGNPSNPDTAASGDGFVLASITFRGQNLGDADFSFGPVVYTDGDGTVIADETTLEILVVDASDSPLPSPHVTVTSAAVVSGSVDLQGRSDESGVDARLTPGNYFDTTDAAGDFTITEVPAGTFTLRVSMPRYLAAEKPINVPDTVTSSTGNDVELLGGDINQDDRINIQDLAMMGARFGTTLTEPNWDDNGRADINNDGDVNIQDLAIAGGNFGKETGDYSW